MGGKDGLKCRLRFVQLALDDRNIWYKWGGDDLAGIDCSGFVIKEGKCVGLFPEDYDNTAAGIRRYFNNKTEVEEPFVGCLIFYGKPKITHVMICLDDMSVIGATGGGSKVKTVADAMRYNAFVEVRPFNYREDIVVIIDPFNERNDNGGAYD